MESPSWSLRSHFDAGEQPRSNKGAVKHCPPLNPLLGAAKSLLGLFQAWRGLGKKGCPFFMAALLVKSW